MGMVQAQLRVDSGEVACDSIPLVVVFQFCGLYVCGGPCFDILYRMLVVRSVALPVSSTLACIIFRILVTVLGSLRR